MKYILVTGGVISGIGKGVIASSIGKILKSSGYEVTAIKIDPYIGSKTYNKQGERCVLGDGAKVDLGDYERFMDIKLHPDNAITTGKMLDDLKTRERNGEFRGQTVQGFQGVIDCIQAWVERVALKPVSENVPQICIIELGGTIGDGECVRFVEAFRQIQSRVKRENFFGVHVSWMPQLKATGEDKTKPTRYSVIKLRTLGLASDLIVCRSERPIAESTKEKISLGCRVPIEQVINIPDVECLYDVPNLLEQQGVLEFFHKRLQILSMDIRSNKVLLKQSHQWQKLPKRINNSTQEVRIALVGKYSKLEDSYDSVIKALEHASLKCNVKLNLQFIAASSLEKDTQKDDLVSYHKAWLNLCEADGVIVPGGFGATGIEGKIAAIEWARKNRKPFLGICLGFQLAVVEFARNVLGWEDAHTIEITQDRTKRNVVIEMEEHNTGIMGGTMRLGKKLTRFTNKKDSILWKLYNEQDCVEERHRHRCKVEKAYVPDFEEAGLKFVGEDDTGERLEILELQDHPYFVAVQFHPEYISRPLKPSPPYLGLILASCNRLNHYVSKSHSSSSLRDTDSKEN